MSLLDALKQSKSNPNPAEISNVYKITKHIKKRQDLDSKSSKANRPKSRDIQMRSKITVFGDPNIFTSLEELSREVRKICLKNKRMKYGITKKKSTSYYVKEPFLRSVLEKCLEDEHYYSRRGMFLLIKKSVFSENLNDILCQCLIKYNDLDLIFRISNTEKIFISERMKIIALKQFLRSFNSDDVKGILNDINLNSIKSVFKDISKTILYILNTEFDEFQLQHHMKILLPDEAAVLLQFLRYCLSQTFPSLLLPSEPKDELFSGNVSKKKILSWIDCLVTSHLLTLMSLNSCKPLVKALQQDSNNQKMFIEQMREMLPFMNCIKERKRPPQFASSYKIETIQI